MEDSVGVSAGGLEKATLGALGALATEEDEAGVTASEGAGVEATEGVGVIFSALMSLRAALAPEEFLAPCCSMCLLFGCVWL